VGLILLAGGASSTLDMIFDIIKTRFGPAVEFDVPSLFTYNAESEMRVSMACRFGRQIKNSY